MIEITYNARNDFGPGWFSGTRIFSDWPVFTYWLRQQLDEGREVLVTSYREI